MTCRPAPPGAIGRTPLAWKTHGLPGFQRLAVDLERRVLRVEDRLADAGVSLGQEAALDELHVLEDVRAAAVDLLARRERHLQVGRAGQEDLALDLVVLQVRQPVGVEVAHPARDRRLLRSAQQGVGIAQAQAGVTRFLGLLPVMLVLPGIGRNPNEASRPFLLERPVDRAARSCRGRPESGASGPALPPCGGARAARAPSCHDRGRFPRRRCPGPDEG